MVNEFLTGLSATQPVLWALFVLGVIGAASLALSLFWGGLFRIGSWIWGFRIWGARPGSRAD